MELKRKKIISVILLTELVAVLILLNGCKKSTPTTNETTTITSQEKTQPETETIVQVDEQIEQTICPVMGEPIDKDIYVTFLGKKVYFCSKESEEKFMEEPEKYLDKLPQFQK
jgi:YHS domain-containing protein